MLRILTAGESHGPKLTLILEGMPSGLPISGEKIQTQLTRRQPGFPFRRLPAVTGRSVKLLLLRPARLWKFFGLVSAARPALDYPFGIGGCGLAC